jgi:ketosteroid isomerase-like protein
MNDGVVEVAVLALDARRFEAMIEKDIETLKAILDDDLLWTHASASTDNKEVFLERIGSGATQYKEIARSDEKIRLFGDAAIVSAIATMRAVVGGKELALRNRSCNVWIKRAEQWRMVHWQSTALPG